MLSSSFSSSTFSGKKNPMCRHRRRRRCHRRRRRRCRRRCRRCHRRRRHRNAEPRTDPD